MQFCKGSIVQLRPSTSNKVKIKDFFLFSIFCVNPKALTNDGDWCRQQFGHMSLVYVACQKLIFWFQQKRNDINQGDDVYQGGSVVKVSTSHHTFNCSNEGWSVSPNFLVYKFWWTPYNNLLRMPRECHWGLSRFQNVSNGFNRQIPQKMDSLDSFQKILHWGRGYSYLSYWQRKMLRKDQIFNDMCRRKRTIFP